MSHKPYPSGRLTHGVVDGLNRLMQEHGFGPDDITAIRAEVPPLVHRLVGRPDIPAPEANYAKLCLRFVAGTFLAHGKVDVPHFRGEALTDPATHRYASLVDVVLDANPDQNALDPQTISVTLANGATPAIHLPHVYGHPAVPLTAAENEEKFRRCATYGRIPLPAPRAAVLIDTIARIEAMEDIAGLARLTLGTTP
jgi:2-methylcitrate dehydratase PrpD